MGSVSLWHWVIVIAVLFVVVFPTVKIPQEGGIQRVVVPCCVRARLELDHALGFRLRIVAEPAPRRTLKLLT